MKARKFVELQQVKTEIYEMIKARLATKPKVDCNAAAQDAWMMTYGILIFHYPPSVAAFKYIEELFVKHICKTNGTECTNLNLQAYIIMKHLKLIFFCTWCMPFSNVGSTCLAWITVHIGHATVIQNIDHNLMPDILFCSDGGVTCGQVYS